MKNDRFSRSRELYSRAKENIAGGVNSGLRSHEKPVPVYFERGDGSRLFDVDGNDYIDYALGQGALLLGHAHPDIASAIGEQARRGTHWAAQCELEIEVAELLCELVPCCEKVRFNNSATEALIAAFRLARAFTDRSKILRFEGHYHGWNDEGLFGFRSPPERWGTVESPLCKHPSAGILPPLAEFQAIAQWNDPLSVEACFERQGDKIAAVICEPVLCNTGCIQPEPGFLAKLRQLSHEYGALLIFDETITGFRFGASGAEGWCGVQPDICIFGKAVGGGVPFAAIGGGDPVMELIADGRVVHAGTLNANPLCLAAARASLQFYKNHQSEYPDNLRRLGSRLMEGLHALSSRYNIELATSGPGAAFQSSFTSSPPPRNYREFILRSDQPRWERLREELLIRGVRVLERGLWFLSAVHTDADIDESLDRTEMAIKAFTG